ncbi:MAG: aminoacyl-tRNA hydrolase [Patescibacteria group bacterium]
MALFQKKPDVGGSNKPIYTLGLQKTVLIVGLGNPGKKYNGTRHNIGFEVIDALALSQEITDWADKKDLKCLVATGNIGFTRVILCKPTTYMNLSGEAVQAISHFYKISLDSIVAVHDELDIPFGQIRTRVGGSDAGHNGIKSVIEQIGESFGRIRIGVGPKTPPRIDSADFVLAKFSSDEQTQRENLLREATSILTEYIHGAQLASETRSFIV